MLIKKWGGGRFVVRVVACSRWSRVRVRTVPFGAGGADLCGEIRLSRSRSVRIPVIPGDTSGSQFSAGSIILQGPALTRYHNFIRCHGWRFDRPAFT